MTSKFIGAVLTPALSAAATALLPLVLGGTPQSIATTYGIVLALLVAAGVAAAYLWAEDFPVDDDVQTKMELYWQAWWWFKYMFIGVAVLALGLGLVGARYLGFAWRIAVLLALFHATLVTLLLWLFSYIAISQR